MELGSNQSNRNVAAQQVLAPRTPPPSQLRILARHSQFPSLRIWFRQSSRLQSKSDSLGSSQRYFVRWRDHLRLLCAKTSLALLHGEGSYGVEAAMYGLYVVRMFLSRFHAMPVACACVCRTEASLPWTALWFGGPGGNTWLLPIVYARLGGPFDNEER